MSVECPICLQPVVQSDIEGHVEDCLNPKKKEKPILRQRSSSFVSSDINSFFKKTPVKRKVNEKLKVVKKKKINLPPLSPCIINGSDSNNNSNISITEDTSFISFSYEEKENYTPLKSEFKEWPSNQEETKFDQEINKKNSLEPRKNIKEKNFGRSKFLVIGDVPLAEQMRPQTLDFFYGQNSLGAQNLLKELFISNKIPSMILWGPPGCGKTSLAHIISQRCKESDSRYRFVTLSATMAGINDVKEAVKVAKNEKKLTNRKTVLFIDEIHRFNKMQQDTFLPHVEDGTIVLVGATTENPSFHINNALVSRCHVVVFHGLETETIMKILLDVMDLLNAADQREGRLNFEEGALKLIAEYANGDARCALNKLDMILQAKMNKTDDSQTEPFISCQLIKEDYNDSKEIMFHLPHQTKEEREGDYEYSQRTHSYVIADPSNPNTWNTWISKRHWQEELQRCCVNYDRAGDQHFELISALHKSIRGSDIDASIYWLARMLEGGETPLYIARRLVRIASEDIGLADPNALSQAVSAYQACHFIGMPECDVILAQAVTYLAKAPKSIAVYEAYKSAKAFIKNYSGSQPEVPLHLRNAPTCLMEKLGYGKDYKYTPLFKEDSTQEYLPKSMQGKVFFATTDLT